MAGLLAVVGFAVAMWVLNRVLRRAESDGNFDPGAVSSASRPGLRFFFDYGERGWSRDGNRQRPPDR